PQLSTLSLHDALPISVTRADRSLRKAGYPAGVEFKVGERYVAAMVGEGEFEVMLLSPAPPKWLPEAGGPLVVHMWQVRRDDGHRSEEHTSELQSRGHL